MDPAITSYNAAQSGADRDIVNQLATLIHAGLPDAESKVWHGHPVWFLEGNPIVGYSVLKDGVQLMFWSGQSFEEEGLQAEGKFKAAAVRYRSADEVEAKNLKRWLKKGREIQWDYKNIVKRKGVLLRLN